MSKVRIEVEKLKLYKALHRKADGTLLCSPNKEKEQIYEVGKTYEIEGDIKICENGFHAVKNLRNIFYYYPAIWSTEIAIVEADGLIEYDDGEDKVCCQKITIKEILSASEIENLLKEESLENLRANAIYNSKIFWKAYGVESSTYICGSAGVSESNSIYNSQGLFRCKQIKHSEGLESCEVGSELGGCYNVDFGAYSYGISTSIDIYQSQAVHYGYAVKHSVSVNRSYGVAYSKCIDMSMYIHECECLSNCLFCYKLNNKQFHIFNKKVKPALYYDIYRKIKRIGKDYYPIFTKMREECLKHEGKWKVDIMNALDESTIMYKTIKENKEFLDYIKSLKVFDKKIFDIIVKGKKTFDIK